MYSKILGYSIFSGTKEELIHKIITFQKVNIISGNPEILFNGINDRELYSNFTGSNSIIIPDGVGTVLASKLAHEPVKEKIAGIEVMEEILKYCRLNNKGVYLLGAATEVLEECINNIRKKYPDINIAGSHNGYFDMEHCSHIIDDIKKSDAYALFAAMGSPRQEKFIIKHMEELPCSIFMGVGGSFDIFAGKINRAPKWMIKLGVEWLYRVAKEPVRIKRLSSIPKFLLKVMLQRKN